MTSALRVWFLATALWAVFLMPASAQAPMVCGARDGIIHSLRSNFEEERVATGLSRTGALVELFTARDGSTWTILLTSPNGTTCLLGAGKSWDYFMWTAPKRERKT